jgi:hypothetical protein
MKRVTKVVQIQGTGKRVDETVGVISPVGQKTNLKRCTGVYIVDIVARYVAVLAYLGQNSTVDILHGVHDHF